MSKTNPVLIAAASAISAIAIIGAVLFIVVFVDDDQVVAPTALKTETTGEEPVFQVEQQIDVALFFLSPSYNYKLEPVPRKIINVISLTRQASEVMGMLMAGPAENEGAYRAIPRQARFRRLFIDKQGIAHVIFSNELASQHTGGTAAELLTVYSIVNTLCVNFPSIQAVNIIVENHNSSTLAGHVDISLPLRLDSSFFNNSTFSALNSSSEAETEESDDATEIDTTDTAGETNDQ